ncbi:hypothetical protein OV208_36605 [Corallococcus sp. bb12-1]|uniref:hypothetical protein n=1 Tax=Corallococcus sp. bb12-1 TaxID=2996784 RepID=UPI0022711228|nr:hypothetical protein [Corallococcus sp. bb12-1]MCY1046884.1 hypothetical protein [Corallococcus sp. bb12-1]
MPAARKKWTPEEKLRVLVAAQGLTGEELGALLRGEGLHEEKLKEWQQAAAEKRVKELERELHRKEKALAETAALLVLENKLQATGWGERHLDDEDDAVDEKREK